MEGIYVGKVKRSVINKDNVNLLFVDHRQDIHHLSDVIDYEDTAYCLVPTNDIIINNDEILKLRDEVKRLTEACNGWEAECNDWKARYAKANNELFQKGLAYGTLETEYKNEKIAGGILLKDRDALKEKVDTLEAELNSLRAENKRLRQLMATSMSNLFEGSGITINLTQPNGPESLTLEFDIPELNEAKKKVEDLEKKLAASKSNETFWRDRKEEEEDYHHYWLHTFDRAVKQAADKGIHIDVRGTDEDCNAGVVVVDNVKAKDLEKQMVETFADLEKRLAATKSKETYWVHTFNRAVTQAEQKGVYIGVSGNDEKNNAGVVIVDNGKANELESQIVQMEDANQKLRQRISAADEEIEELKSQYTSRPATGWRNTYYSAVEMAKAEGVTIELQDWDLKANVAHLKVMNHRAANLERQIKRLEDDNAAKGDHWKRNYEELTEYWDNTYKDIVAAGKKVGVKIDLKGRKPDGNVGTVYITNEKALELMVNVSDTKHEYNKKWQAMLNALKAKGVEVIYMGEQDGKPCVDVKIPGWDSDKEWVTTFSKRVAELLADKFGLESERDELKEQCDILRKDGVLKGQQCLKLKADLDALKKEYGRVLSELAELKSENVAEVRYDFRPNCLTIIYTKRDGSKQSISMDSSEAIDATSISCGTVPKCSSCAHYMHNPSRFAHDWCYMPIPKEGEAGYIRKLNKEEAEGPACSDFKARKE